MGFLTVSPEPCWDLQLHRHIADHLEMVEAGLEVGCYLPFLPHYKGTLDVWPCLGRGGGIASVFISNWQSKQMKLYCYSRFLSRWEEGAWCWRRVPLSHLRQPHFNWSGRPAPIPFFTLGVSNPSPQQEHACCVTRSPACLWWSLS